MGAMSRLHAESAPDRADAAELRAAELQATIDRIAGALGVFDLGPLLRAAASPGLTATESAMVIEARHAIWRARAILGESGDYRGDYDN